MNHIGIIMEQNNKASLKKLGIIYSLLFLMEVFMGMYMGNSILDHFDLFMILILIALGLIIRIHFQRVQYMMSSGSFQRTMLLPIDRRSLLWSEVIFVGASIVCLILIQYLVWILLYGLLYNDMLQMANQFFFYTLSNHALIAIAPPSFYGMMLLLSQIISLSFCICAILYSFILCKNRYATIVLGLLQLWIMMRVSGLQNNWILLILLWIIVIMNDAILHKLLMIRRVKS